jgi:hypothetical protein
VRALARVVTPTGALRAGPALLVTIAGFAVALALTIGYVAHTRQQDDRRWCQLLSTLIAPQPAGPPATAQEARGRQITEQLDRLYHDLGCG